MNPPRKTIFSTTIACIACIAAPSFINGQILIYDYSEAMFFNEQAAVSGLEAPGYGRGAAMVDFDNDGLLDIIATRAGFPVEFFRQKNNGTFELMNSIWSVPATQDESWGVIAADFDNDGDKDIYFSNGGFSGAEVNVMLRNDLNTSGKFTDISASSGACGLIVANFGGSAFDYDNDGDLDIFLSSSIGTGSIRPPCELYRNDGNMQFTNTAPAAGIIHQGDFRNCGVADYDQDGYMDVIVGNMDSFNILYHNNGDGTFTNQALAAGVQDPYRSFGATFEDFNNDGWPDLFVPKYEFTGVRTSSIFINNKDGTFRDISAFARMSSQGDMGHNTGDINADGFPDILIGTGHPYWERKDLVKAMFPVRYSDAMSSRNAAAYLGLDAIGDSRSHGYALGDIDNDGDVDVYNNNGGPSQIPSSWGYNALYLAQGNTSNWMKMSLEGVLSNRDAIGARVRVETNNGRDIWRYPASGKGFCNTDSPILHFGLGKTATRANIAEISWPSGLVQTYVNLPTRDQHDIIETGISFSGNPAVGGQVTVKATGPRNGRVELLYSSVLVYNPDPVNHVVHRLGGTPFYLGPTSLDAQGRANITFNIPNDPSLSGNSLFLQAVVIDVLYPNRIAVKTNAVELAIP
jgi:hypothetical protein